MSIKNNLRLIIGIGVLILGVIFMVIPFIPLGYIFLFIGAFLLAPRVPFLRKFMRWLKRKDKSGKLEKAEDKVDDIFTNKKEKENKKGMNKNEKIYKVK